MTAGALIAALGAAPLALTGSEDVSTTETTGAVLTPLTPTSATPAGGRAHEERAAESVVRRVDIVPLLAYIAFATALGWQLGQDANWDVRNYHLYNPFMWLSGRFDRDVHVAGVQTFLNPILHVPFYFAIKMEVPPLWYGLALSGIHGVLLFFVHRITALTLTAHGSWSAATGGALAAITAAYGAAVYAEIGATLGDNTIGLLVLGALAVVIANAHADRVSMLRAARRAGLAVGAAAGAKLVASVYILGMLGAVLMMPGGGRVRVQRVLHFGSAVAAGLAVTGGYWMWLMYEHFESPLFPFFNAVFASPLAPAQNFSDAFRPGSLLANVEFPFHFFGNQMVAAETYFRDGRLPAALVSLTVMSLVGVARWLSTRGTTASIENVRLRQLAAFFVVSYVVWLATFALYRYALALEALSAAVIVACAVYLARHRREGLLLAVPICVLLILSTKPLAYGRIPWTNSFFGVASDRLMQYREAVVLLTDFPSAYVAPFFPPSTTFLRISSNWGLEPGNQMWQRLHQHVTAAPPSHLYWLEIAPYATQAEADSLLAPFDLTLQQSGCEETTSNFDSLRICRIQRLQK